MVAVTICIPAFGTGESIVPTLQSALRQRHRDVQIAVGVEPVDIETEQVCTRVAAGAPRVRVHVNSDVLGWAGNIAALLQRVDTPLFTVLPHDDLLHPDYVERLVSMLDSRREAVVAYADMVTFGATVRRRSVTVDEGSKAERLLSFFLTGALAIPWRGVTRRDVLDNAVFPSDPFGSFAADCEWAAHLVCQGGVVRVPSPLYGKRTYGPDGGNVSRRWRSAFDLQQRRSAVAHHTQQMTSIADEVVGDGRYRSVRAACDVAMIRREMSMLDDDSDARVKFRARLDDLAERGDSLPRHGNEVAMQARALRRRLRSAPLRAAVRRHPTIESLCRAPANAAVRLSAPQNSHVASNWLGTTQLFEAG